MFEIQIPNKPFVSIAELNEVINQCSAVSDELIQIRFSSNVDRIDLAFLGGLYLYYKDNLKRFTLVGNGPDNQVFSELTHISEIKQTLAQITLLYNDIDWISIKGLSYKPEEALISPLFAPILYIDDKTLTEFFREDATTNVEDLRKKYVGALISDDNEVARTYFAEVPDGHILRRLMKNNAMHSFVYTVLHSIEKPFIKSDGLQESIDLINNIWNFTEEYVAGLYELAKNIVYHSRTKKGIISISSYGTEQKGTRDLETYVFDYGDCGIIPTMIKKLDLAIEEDYKDSKVLNDHYTLKDFFAPGQTRRLYRQIRRGMAHIGLIHFISLMKSNDGQFCISSWGTDQSRDFYGSVESDNVLKSGTFFHFSLPIVRKTAITGVPIVKTGEGFTKDSLAAIPKVLDLRKRIKTIHLEGEVIDTRIDEQNLMNQVSFDDKGVDYYAIDFNSIKITSSSLLRILASLSELTTKSIIVYNVDTSVYSMMVRSNDTYFRSIQNPEGLDTIPYWIKDRAILVYCYHKMPTTDSAGKESSEIHSVYFADLLYGDSFDHFKHINQTIQASFPNLFSITKEETPPLTDANVSDQEEKEEGIDINGTVSPFFYKLSLLPFDLVLSNKNGSSLFEEYLMTAVNKSM